MDQDTLAPPPEARLIRVAREATGMTAGDAAKATNGIVSAAYWRDIERGYGGRRGVRVATKASARVLAHMARTVGVTPERLETEGRRADAAMILAEIMRSSAPPRPAPVPAPAEPRDSAWTLFPTSAEKRALWRLQDGDGRLLSEKIRAELVAAFDQAVSEAARDEEDNGERGRRAAG